MHSFTLLFGFAVLMQGTFTCSPDAEYSSGQFNVIAYYSGNETDINPYPVEKLTHLIYSFCHLKGNRLAVDNEQDSLTILQLVSLKKRNPNLKVLLSLGGWGGCKTCSEVFSTAQGRLEFARSVKDLLAIYRVDGLDLDWEYPAIEGVPGHPFKPEDKQNFTALIEILRSTIGGEYELSFAAGGFRKFLVESIEWEKVVPLLDRVNLMTYDLVGGYSTVTGHHTPLYSTPSLPESTDNAVRFLDSIGVPKNKLVVGAAFYGRVWENVENVNNGLCQSGKFKTSVGHRNLEAYLMSNPGFTSYWDTTAQARYYYNPSLRLFLTLDDPESITLKTLYAKERGLNGIMFWELANDESQGGLLDVIWNITK
jgi:chitinase